MNKDCWTEHSQKRTPFAPLQCKALDTHLKVPNKQKVNLSPFDVENHRHRRAKELGLTSPYKEPYLQNQSFPGLLTDPENVGLNTGMSSMHKSSSIDKFKGDELNTVSFSPLNISCYEGDSLDRSWRLYKFLETSLKSQTLHSYNHNPQKSILTINARTTEILTGNKTAFRLLGIHEDKSSVKLKDFIRTSKDTYLLPDTDFKPNGEVVLISGKVMEVVTKSNQITPVSVWARKLSTESDRCLVIMEPVKNLVGKAWVTLGNKIKHCDKWFAMLFNESPGEMVGCDIQEFIPHLICTAEKEEDGYVLNVPPNGLKYYMIGRRRDGLNFPLNIDIVPYSEEEDGNSEEAEKLGINEALLEVTICFFCHISGLITILPNGVIYSCNTNFSLAFFGYGQDELVGKDITTVIPSFYEDIEYLDTNSVALPPFDEDDHSSHKCCNSEGPTTADSFSAELPRPINPLARPMNSEEMKNPVLAITPVSRESLSSADCSSTYEDSCDNEIIFSANSVEIDSNCDKLDSKEVGAIDCSSQHICNSESQDTLHSNTNESDVNANVLNLAESTNMITEVGEENDSDSFESESEDSESLDEKGSYRSESVSEEEHAGEYEHYYKPMYSPSPIKRRNSLEKRNYLDTAAYISRISSTPKQGSENISKSSHGCSTISIPEGIFNGIGRHCRGSDVAIEYCIKRVILEDGKFLYCLWIQEDPDTRAKRMEKLFAGDKTTSSSSHYETSKTSPTDLEESGSSASSNSILPDEEYIEGSFSEHYTILQHLGKGAFGCIKKAYRNSDGLIVIAKFIKRSEVYKEAWIFDQVLDNTVPLEISLLTTLQHPNIVKVIDVFENQKCFHMIMEKHGSGMDLFEFIERNPKMDEPLSSYIFRQMVSAISYLHAHRVLHRDIKDENVIIDEKFQIKLIDFGSAAFMLNDDEELFKTFCGTTEYCSPEVLKGEKYRGPELEMFALGVTLFTLVLNQNPFLGEQEILKGEYEIHRNISKSLSNLIKHMLEPDPTKRCTLPELENHEWINQPVLIENYKFSDVVFASEDELHPVKYINFTESEEESEEKEENSDSEVSQLESKLEDLNLSEQSHSSSETS